MAAYFVQGRVAGVIWNKKKVGFQYMGKCKLSWFL